MQNNPRLNRTQRKSRNRIRIDLMTNDPAQILHQPAPALVAQRIHYNTHPQPHIISYNIETHTDLFLTDTNRLPLDDLAQDRDALVQDLFPLDPVPVRLDEVRDALAQAHLGPHEALGAVEVPQRVHEHGELGGTADAAGRREVAVVVEGGFQYGGDFGVRLGRVEGLEAAQRVYSVIKGRTQCILNSITA